MNNTSNNGSGILLALILATGLILAGVIMMNFQAGGINNNVAQVDQRVERVEQTVNDVAEDVRLIKYGQQLLAAGQGQPIVVTVK